MFKTGVKELAEACKNVQEDTYFHSIVVDCRDLFKQYDELLVEYVPRSANVMAHVCVTRS